MRWLDSCPFVLAGLHLMGSMIWFHEALRRVLTRVTENNRSHLYDHEIGVHASMERESVRAPKGPRQIGRRESPPSSVQEDHDEKTLQFTGVLGKVLSHDLNPLCCASSHSLWPRAEQVQLVVSNLPPCKQSDVTRTLHWSCVYTLKTKVLN